ncbi:MAG: alanine racemase [Dermatophilaceae bacterium]
MDPVSAFPRPGSPSAAVVDLSALEENVRALRAHAPSAALLAVVKADAYGHGLLPAARAARRAGATWLGVAQMGEAFTLRDNGIQGRVFTWLNVPGADFAGAIRRDIDLSASAPWAVAEIAAAAETTGVTARVHLKVDTGLGRNGAFGPGFAQLVAAAARHEASGAIRVVGVWSHFASADDPGHPTVRQQQDVFEDAVRTAEAAGFELEVRHLANSAATLTNPSAHYDLVRPGLACYGLSPVPDLGGPAAYGLTPVMTLLARLALVKEVPAGTGLSYSHHYVTPSDTRVGLVPMGYADGIPRSASGTGPMTIGGRRYAVAGRVCMDQVVVDLGPESHARAGDVAVLFGPEAAGGPSAQDWAIAAGTISYEIVTRLGARVERVYVGSQEDSS